MFGRVVRRIALQTTDKTKRYFTFAKARGSVIESPQHSLRCGWMDLGYSNILSSRGLLQRKAEARIAREESSTTNLDTRIHESIAKPLTPGGVLRAKVCFSRLNHSSVTC